MLAIDADLPALDQLMRTSADRLMGFADARLVHLARRESLSTVFTIDREDFETYRIDAAGVFATSPAAEPWPRKLAQTVR